MQRGNLVPQTFVAINNAPALSLAPLSGSCVCQCLRSISISWIASASTIARWHASVGSYIHVDSSKQARDWNAVHSLCTWPDRQQNFRGFNFCEWLLTCEKCENKSLAKITNHTVPMCVHHTVCCIMLCSPLLYLCTGRNAGKTWARMSDIGGRQTFVFFHCQLYCKSPIYVVPCVL